MAKKIKELTDALLDREYEDKYEQYETEKSAADLALENECYEQAWNHYYNLYSLKDHTIKGLSYYKGQGAHGLCKVMQQIPNDHEFVEKLIQTDPDLVRRAKERHISNEFARKFVGRKYLVYAADDCGYYPAMEEYALNCVGKGHKKSFVFEYNERDAQVGYQWGKRLVNAKDGHYQAVGYMVQAIYHFALYRKTKDIEEGAAFCDCVMKARELEGDDNEYALCFYAHMCADPKFKFYEDGRYYNPKKGYELFCRVVNEATDPDLIKSASNIKSLLETKYPTMIGR